MPVISVKRDLLFQELGQTYSEADFEKLCFDFGLELDEVTTEMLMRAKEQGTEHIIGDSEEIIYKIDIPANRYDLLCFESLVTGLLVFLEKKPQPRYKTITPVPPRQLEIMRATKSCKRIRPYVACAILRGLKLTKESYNSFIDLQDKLHQNIARKRSLVAIGTHDLDTIKGPFLYDARPPQDIKFIPLNQENEYTGAEIMDLYAHHPQLKSYLPIIRDSPVYPIIYDSNGVVLSMPPIINSNHTKITLDTKNIFIETTATDITKQRIVLETLVTAFSQYCEENYTVEPVQIIYEDTNEIQVLPELEYRTIEIDNSAALKRIGIEETPENVARLLTKMCLKSEVKDNDKILVEVPPTRHDVIHPCDIYEDLGIAWGYNNIKKVMPHTATIGAEFPINKLSDFLRFELAQAGFTETLTFTLCSRDDVADKLGRDFNTIPAVTLSNPKTLEFQVVRTTLLPGILKTLHANKKMPLPLKIFEVSDVVFCDSNMEVGAKNERRLCAVYCNTSAGFEIIHGLLDRIMLLLEVKWSVDKSNEGYYLQATDDPAYFPQRCANIIANGKNIGRMGVLHPDVLQKFELNQPCSAMEINIEHFL